MIQKRYVKALVVIVIAFCIGLVGFFAFSAMYGDGLEKVMEDNGVTEGEPVYTAPLSYGDSYGGALVAGLVGFFIVFVVIFGYLKIVKTRRHDH
jgi:cobalt/nickel transport protein